jgi:hypothetical protein
MKAYLKHTVLVPAFTPLLFEIKIESEEDGRALYAVFNHVDNVKLLGTDLYSTLTQFVAKSDEVIARGVYYRDWYTRRHTEVKWLSKS